MNFLKQYREPCAQNPQKYWFKRKTYGWGWMPARWQGWLSTAVYLVAVLALVWSGDSLEKLLPVGVLTALFLLLCYKTGEKPRWQWGFPKK